MSKKIGIVLPFQNGDLATGSSVLKYREELWPDCDIVWFTVKQHEDLLKFQNVEIRNFPHGWGISQADMNGKYAERIKKDKLEGMPEWEDLSLVKDKNNRLNQDLKNKFPSVADLDEAYFAAPWMLSPIQRHGISYPEVSKKVFGVPKDWEWHPVISFSEEERYSADVYMDILPKGKRLFVETFAGSDQSKLSHDMVIDTMRIVKEKWPDCIFIFASHKYLRSQEDFPENFFNEETVFTCKHFTVRQCALIAEQCDLMISVSSGITVAASAWNIKQPVTLQFCGSEVCSTLALSHCYFKLVTADGKSMEDAKKDYYEALIQTLNKFK